MCIKGSPTITDASSSIIYGADASSSIHGLAPYMGLSIVLVFFIGFMRSDLVMLWFVTSLGCHDESALSIYRVLQLMSLAPYMAVIRPVLTSR